MKREKRYYDYPGTTHAEVEHYLRLGKRLRSEALRAGLATLAGKIGSMARRLRPAPAGARVRKPAAAAPSSGKTASSPRKHRRKTPVLARRRAVAKREEAA